MNPAYDHEKAMAQLKDYVIPSPVLTQAQDAQASGQAHDTSPTTGDQRIEDTADTTGMFLDAPKDPLFQKYRPYYISLLPLAEVKQKEVHQMLDDHGWPWIWRSLTYIQDRKSGRNWEWDDEGEGQSNDAVLLALKGFDLSWSDISLCFSIGMRPSECQLRYEGIGNGTEGIEGS